MGKPKLFLQMVTKKERGSSKKVSREASKSGNVKTCLMAKQQQEVK